MSYPEGAHIALRARLRDTAKQLACFGPKMPMHIPIGEVTTLLDYIDEQDAALYSAWEQGMGEDL